ncbi:MAG: class I SAM-dependent methyltransferase [Actinomycetaceae bacterium]|nr:class I SAM-dependent methyltransferase [Actinomycetaceae bacterium]
MSANPIELVLHPKAWEALTVLEAAPAPSRGELVADLELTADERAAVLTQLDLRDQAQAKLGEFARTMIFTRDGLEQATRLEVAAMHAARFREAGIATVADLGCGIGVDSLAMAGLGIEVRAWDLNPQAVAAATVNLRFHDNATVNLGDVTELDAPSLVQSGVQGIFADPARRTGAQAGGRRINDPEQWSPALSTALSWREHLRAGGHDALGLKVAPGIDYRHIPADFEAHWISVDRQLVEASLWSPDLTSGPQRSATVMRGGEKLTFSDPTDPSSPAEQAPGSALENYIFEPDPAIIRAGLIASVVRDLGLSGTISPSIAYLTSNSIPEGDAAKALTGFEVLEVTTLRPKAISKALRAMDPTGVEVKKRGADINPAALQVALKRILVPKTKDYENELTVFATRIGGRHQAIIARRL